MVDRGQVSIGMLVSAVHHDVVAAALGAAGIRAQRRDAKLPPQVVLYVLMGLWLFADEAYQEVCKKVTGYLDELGLWSAPWSPPTASALTQARKRVPPAVVASVFETVARPLTSEFTPGAFLGCFPGPVWRMLAIDGYELDVPDTEANVAAYGRAGAAGAGEGGAGEGVEAVGSAYPKVRVTSIIEAATRAPLYVTFDAHAVCEKALAGRLYGRLGPGQVLLADRGFYSYAAYEQVIATGADVIWRVPASVELPLVQVLADGSYLALIYSPACRAGARKRALAAARADPSGGGLDPDRQGRLVRVVEYDIPDRGNPAERELFVLLTSITEYTDLSATALAAAYAQRWEAETSFAEDKTTLPASREVLRSKSPQLVEQEVWALQLTAYALAALRARAADAVGVDPDRVSFIATLRLARRTATGTAGFPP